MPQTVEQNYISLKIELLAGVDILEIDAIICMVQPSRPIGTTIV